MDTAVISIGNTDDKLKQEEWSRYVSDVQDILIRWNYSIYFHGLSVGSAPWQNACWIVQINNGNYNANARVVNLRLLLSTLAREYRQDSIALLLGDTEFVTSRV